MSTTPQPVVEPIIEPDLPIVDAHHHFWIFDEEKLRAYETSGNILMQGLAPVFREYKSYLLDDFLAHARSGHNIRASVFVQAGAMYRADGPEEMKSLGEVEFVNGIAAMSASGLYGDIRVAAGIVGNANLRLGDAVQPVLEAHIRAAGDRYRGVRDAVSRNPDIIFGKSGPSVMSDEKFLEGFKWLGKLGLSFDAFLFEPQLPELIDLARAFPDTQIILNHVGDPLGIGAYEGKREERFPIWRDNIRTLAKCENVVTKIGGLATPLQGFPSWLAEPRFNSEQMAAEWRPYVETAIDAFGADRCMFESDFPPDAGGCSYATLWNAFKRIVAGASREEKLALFSGTATRAYRLNL